MNAVILAAGEGTRLGRATQAKAKPMFEIGGKPILQHNIELCRKHDVRTIFINTHHLPSQITEFFGDGSRFGVAIRYSYEPELLGTAGALLNFRKDLNKDPFFVLYGDNVITYDLKSIAEFHQKKGGIATMALFHKDDVSLSGVATVEKDGRVTKFIEKPTHAEQVSHLVNAGVYVLDPRIFTHIPSGFSDFGNDVFPRVLAAGKRIYGMVMKDSVVAVDTAELWDTARGGV